MARIGYTIGDAPQGNNDFVDIFHFEITKKAKLKNPNQVSETTGEIDIDTNPDNDPRNPGPPDGKVDFGHEDLEGLATVKKQVVAVSESDLPAAEPPDDRGVVVTSVDKPNNGANAPDVRDITRGDFRFGTEAGAAGIGKKLYNIQGSTGTNVFPTGSSLYEITKFTKGDKARAKLIGTPVETVPVGNIDTERVNDLYADSLTNYKGGLIAGDFATDDGNKNFLYQVPVSGPNAGKLIHGVPVVDKKKNDVDSEFKDNQDRLIFDLDAGLGYIGKGNKINALLEDGTFLTIQLGFKNGSLNSAEVTHSDVIEPLKGLFNGPDSIDFEGFTIINE